MNDDIIKVGERLPRIMSAKPLTGRTIEIMWEGGIVKIVDLKPALASRRLYIPLRDDDALFNTLSVSEYGDAIEWATDSTFPQSGLISLRPWISAMTSFV